MDLAYTGPRAGAGENASYRSPANSSDRARQREIRGPREGRIVAEASGRGVSPVIRPARLGFTNCINWLAGIINVPKSSSAKCEGVKIFPTDVAEAQVLAMPAPTDGAGIDAAHVDDDRLRIPLQFDAPIEGI